MMKSSNARISLPPLVISLEKEGSLQFLRRGLGGFLHKSVCQYNDAASREKIKDTVDSSRDADSQLKKSSLEKLRVWFSKLRAKFPQEFYLPYSFCPGFGIKVLQKLFHRDMSILLLIEFDKPQRTTSFTIIIYRIWHVYANGGSAQHAGRENKTLPDFFGKLPHIKAGREPRPYHKFSKKTGSVFGFSGELPKPFFR
ncbi:MAG TPA: hypothetical protein PLW97_13845, partial [Synergistaceae bacterium]|nr:hypothetical protein [Synergistaceae bacterium]